jgi:hypothetical protein
MKTEKIHFAIEVVDGFPPIGVETLNARICDDGTFEIMNTPFFVKEVAYGDIVNAQLSVEGRLEFVSCAKPSNYKAIAVILLSPDVRVQLIDDLRTKDCIIEYGEFPGCRMLAIAIPDTTDYAPIRSLLDKYEKSEILSYAELVA